MSNELWLKELAQAKRDQDAESRFDERWDRLSAGTLSPEEEAELRALAETSPEAAEAYEAFRPLGPDFQARIVQAIRKQDFVPAPEPEPLPKPDNLDNPDNLVHFWQRRSFKVGWSIAAALAATIVFIIIPPRPTYPPLQTYVANVGGGDQLIRGATEPVQGLQVFSQGSLLTLDAAPEQTVTGPVDPVEAQAFASRGTEWVSLDLPSREANGAVLLQGTLGSEISLPPGDWKIWIVVGRPGKLPGEKELKAELAAGRDRHEEWQVMTKNIRVK